MTTTNRWSRKVTETSNALDLKHRVFTKSPREIARSLKRSAERSHRRKSDPYRSTGHGWSAPRTSCGVCTDGLSREHDPRLDLDRAALARHVHATGADHT